MAKIRLFKITLLSLRSSYVQPVNCVGDAMDSEADGAQPGEKWELELVEMDEEEVRGAAGVRGALKTHQPRPHGRGWCDGPAPACYRLSAGAAVWMQDLAVSTPPPPPPRPGCLHSRSGPAGRAPGSVAGESQAATAPHTHTSRASTFALVLIASSI